VVAVLRLDSDGVASAARQVAAAPPAGVPAAAVTAAASDPVSVTVAHVVGARIAVLGLGSGLACALTQVAAARLHANAGEYGTQEYLNAATLGAGGAPAAVPGGDTAAAPASPVPLSIPAPQSATAPTSAKHIAQLIHAGPGPQPLYDAAQRLRGHADDLRDASTALRGATGTLEDSWFSGAGLAAHGRITELADFYEQHAEAVTAAAQHAQAQGDNVSRARSAIPRPEDFENVESRLRAAMRANAQSKGAFSAVVAELQAQHGQLTAKTTAGFTDYGSGAATALDAPQSPPPPGANPPPSGPDDVIVRGDGRHDPTVQMAGFGQGGAPLSPGGDDPLPPTAPGAQPQIGPFPVPPQVAAAAPPGPPHPNSPLDQMLLPGQGPAPAPGANPLDPLYQQVIHPAAPVPSGPLSPDVIAALRAYGIDPDKLRADQQFSWGALIGKAMEGCGVGGAAAGLWGLLGGPLDVPAIVGGCVAVGAGDAGHYAIDHAK
jgi:hypothetical protein